jgi:SAM-dependent methyltransferase
MKLFKNKIASVQTQDNFLYSGIEELLDSKDGSKNYNDDVVLKLAKGLGISRKFSLSGDFAEFGAGTGSLAQIWQIKFGLSPICIEIDPTLIQLLRFKGFTAHESINSISNSLSFVYTSNVLEHIDDDVKALTEIRIRMKPDAKLGIYVPAIPFLYSGLDKKVGHYRRYTKKELIEKVSQAGFTVQDCYYNDSLGVIASLMVKMLGYKGKVGLGSKKSLVFYDTRIYPFSKMLDRLIFRKIIGKNLFLFADNNIK